MDFLVGSHSLEFWDSRPVRGLEAATRGRIRTREITLQFRWGSAPRHQQKPQIYLWLLMAHQHSSVESKVKTSSCWVLPEVWPGLCEALCSI